MAFPKLAGGLLLPLALVLLSEPAYAQLKSNQDRSTQCSVSGGQLATVNAQTITCTLRGETGIASVTCTEGQQCTCTGSGCGEYGGDFALDRRFDQGRVDPGRRLGQDRQLEQGQQSERGRRVGQGRPIDQATERGLQLGKDMKVVKRFDSDDKIMAKLPPGLRENDKARLESLMDQSLSAIESGDGETAVTAIKEFQDTLELSTGVGLDDGSPWLDCGKHCQHLLDAGDAPGYAVCYWACVIRGGPVFQPGGVAPTRRMEP